MPNSRNVDVAVLLATFNGAQFIDEQISSLKKNSTHFTLHWLDDHSVDTSRDVVRAVARRSGIQLNEWHQPQHLGVPATFFSLLESVDADIYLFCDQDDIWQPGKIDATVTSLLPHLATPTLSCTDPLMFREQDRSALYRFSDVVGVDPKLAMQESRLFMSIFANGHTQGFTRKLRDTYMIHREIARTHAYMHDEWMHAIAVAAGSVQLLQNAPTTIYRWHGSNESGTRGSWGGRGRGRVTATWKQQQHFRRILSRHARGFLLASPTLPQGPKLERLIEIARLVASLNQRQTVSTVLALLRRGVMSPCLRLALPLAAACLWSSAGPE
jgi:rhamnosyltransferase